MSDAEHRRAALLKARYGEHSPRPTIAWNPVIEAQLAHRSVRAFADAPLPAHALETMVAAAQSASSSSALQQWSVVALTDPDLKLAVSELVGGTIRPFQMPYLHEAPALLLWVADTSRTAAIARARGGEPVVLDHLDSFLEASVDVALASQNAALAAESMGLGVVYLGVLRNVARQVADLVGLPPLAMVTFGMAVGRPDPARASAPRPRLPQAAVLHRNGYAADRFREELPAYEDSYRHFRESQGMRAETWQEAVHDCATSMPYMMGRENLREDVAARGFGLR